MPAGPYYTAAEDQFLIDTHATHSMAAQAAHLGRSRNAIAQRRQHLTRAGLVSPATRKNSRPWTEDDRMRAVLMTQEGRSVASMARSLRRTPAAVLCHLSARGISISGIRRDPLMTTRSAAQVARLFGMNERAVLGWIAKNLLAARRNRKYRPTAARQKSAGYTFWRITDDALYAFISDRTHWPLWDVERMTDPDWRSYAAATRQAASGRWLTVGEVGARFCYSEAAVQRWIRCGLLPAMHARDAYWIWSEDSDGFLPPLVTRYQRKAA